MTSESSIAVPLSARVAGAPISWGVCEVPGWGHQLPPERVLAEMRDLGLRATEFGPVGYLETEPAAKAAQLADYGMSAVGGFLPVVLHDPQHDPMAEVDEFIDGCLASGAGVVVLAAATGVDGYDDRPELDDQGWATLLANLDRINDHAAQRGVVASLHPHIGTMIESGPETERVLAGSQIGLCIDTGHLAVAGADPVAITQANPERIVHVHLKDVNPELAAKVQAGEITFGRAVNAGVFCPLGEGSVDVAAMVRTLESCGYQGWYVLEQDVQLAEDNQDADPLADVRRCRDYLLAVAAE